MRFFLWKCVAIFAGASLIVICSCEKHQVGEMPEVQKEHVDLAKAAVEAGVSPAPHKAADTAATTEASPTPAEFFPEKKNP
jgi:hypothetical protein